MQVVSFLPFVFPLCDFARHQLESSRTSLDGKLTATAIQSIRRTDTSSLCALGMPPFSLSSHLVIGSDEKPVRNSELIPESSMEYPYSLDTRPRMRPAP